MNTYILLVVFALVVVFVIGFLWYKGYMDRFLTGNDSVPEKVPQEEKSQSKSIRIRPSARYQPQPGRSTGQRRLFQTNKGMKAYYVNEQGLPITTSSQGA